MNSVQTHIDMHSLAGREVRKFFPNPPPPAKPGYYDGKVTEYSGGRRFLVTYDDGDSEHLDYDDLWEIMLRRPSYDEGTPAE